MLSRRPTMSRAVRDPLGDELRGGVPPLPRGGLRASPAHPLPRVLTVGLGLGSEVVPLVERTGLDEGYLDLTPLASDYSRARAVAERYRRPCGRRRASPARSGSPRRRSSRRSRPTGASPAASRSCRPDSEAASSRRSCPGAAGSRAACGAAAGGRGRDDDRALAALSDLDLRALLPGQVGRMLRDRARGIDAAGSRPRASGSRSRSRRPSSAT